MASRKAPSRTLIVLVIFALIWLIGVGVQYAQFEADPVKELYVRDGVIGGEVDFVSARAGDCATFTIILAIPLLVILLYKRGGSRNDAAADQQLTGRPASGAAAEGWFPDPTARHELRYWGGAAWTEHVSDAGIAGVDPPDA